ncbi:uncharacterized protein CANTADRAFT_25403 [Suhomyces tanzawaensis NRRL Y-17324]|uniref:Uncharacterized protein n=1 Tax=Suhomyces tanzawaensis NRRL Y-17324 TaxID=984487 RepID=A0A1E4SNT2_9ASCO|nr:uncharacterized protein CANTADRAFT_25403 [Suhomyces tanzawaensis NRRL Y-17324]ODV81179.1 hypothetical protein CANTADRAFT_25403 [Suhomyces tanzawaensis NRRL Y-17324]
MKWSGAWAPKGNTPIVKILSTSAENITILGAICFQGVKSRIYSELYVIQCLLRHTAIYR